MDKYEYKVRADEIKSLISEGKYADAVKIADGIDWRRVKSVMMLCTISDLYKINKRYEDSRDILLLAYERHTGGRLIVYSLCELSIKLGETVQAIEYYKEFVQLAPKDSGRYILQYKLYEAQEVRLEERIAVLEELKKRDYREKWAYELACLYHKAGMESKCVEECNEMLLWFGDGKYILKALELKMLHEPLDEIQQAKYEQMKQTGGFILPDPDVDQQEFLEEAGDETEDEEENEFSLEENMLSGNTQEILEKDDLDIQVKTVDVSQYNTINLQKELAESMKEFLEDDTEGEAPAQKPKDPQRTQVYKPVTGFDSRTHPEEKEQESESDAKARPDAGEIQRITDEYLLQKQKEAEKEREKAKARNNSEEVFFGNTAEVNIQDVISELTEKNSTSSLFSPIEEQKEDLADTESRDIPEADPNPKLSNTGVIRSFHKPSGYDGILTQEYDGQISLVVPEQEKIEKQITGQLSIEDIMTEWEKMKQESERKRMEEIRKRVHQQTDTLFADFDESTKSGLLEELEKAMVTAALKEEKLKAAAERPKVVKAADMADKTQKEKRGGKVVEFESRVPEAEPKADEDELLIEELLNNPEDPDEKEVSGISEDIADTVEDEELSSDVETEETENYFEEESEPKAIPADQKSIKKSAGKERAAEERHRAKEDVEENENKYTVREMTGGEREQFAPFIHHRHTRRQIVEAIDNISMASYTGNVIITGDEGTGTIDLAKLLVKEIQLSDSNFSGKVAKISGSTMNRKDISATLSKLSGGALIIEGASSMKRGSVEQLLRELNQEGRGMIVLLEDTKSKMNDFIGKYPDLSGPFNLRVDVEALDDQTLVKYARKYALDQEYTIDELGVLALHTRIADMQTSDHEVTLAEIEELVDEAIYYADKKTPKHFFDVLLGKRYDEEDMIVLRENDFMHY